MEKKRKGWRRAAVFGVLGAAFGIALVEGASEVKQSAPLAVERKAGEGNVSMLARGVCRAAVPLALNDPDSVEFLPSSTWTVTLGADHRHVVRLGLRAKNVFNATIPAEFDCYVEDRGGRT